jgi:hypothetical protein
MAVSPPKTILTTHERSKVVGRAFAEGCGGGVINIFKLQELAKRKIIVPRVASYGILRGCGEAIKAAKDYWHIDHGYFFRSSTPEAYDGYYRITKNNFWHDGLSKCNSDRFARLKMQGLQLKDWRKTGNHIIVVPPSKYMADHWGMHDWLRDIVAEIKKYTDREIVVSIKNETPLERVLPNAWALVTDHSNAGITALLEGVPTIFTNPARKLGEISEIENPPMDRDFFYGLAYQQWTLEEIRSGEAWNYLGDTKR